MKNFAGSAASPEAKVQPFRRLLDVSLSDRCTFAGFCWLGVFVAIALTQTSAGASEFQFDRDTLAFANETVFEYHEGHPYSRKKSNEQSETYKRRCFVLCRTAMQFRKFARFDPRGAPLDDESLATRLRAVTRRQAWAGPLPEDQRVVFPGYANLREMSKARGKVLQENIGLGWPVYFRLGNTRMLIEHDPKYQEEMHANLNEALARGDVFAGFLSTYPRLSINHSILIYKRKSVSPNPGIERYLAYDPNHPESPRELVWFLRTRAFAYQKDWDFIGGFVRVYQIYGKWLQ